MFTEDLQKQYGCVCLRHGDHTDPVCYKQKQLLEEDDVLAELNLPYLRRLREKSISEGLAEGRAAGRREGEAELLLRQLQIRFGALPEEVTTRIHHAPTEALLRWSERILTAPTLAAVFAE